MDTQRTKTLQQAYKENYSLGCLATDIGSKFALISLVCFLTKQARLKSPTATTYQVIQKVRGLKIEQSSEQLLRGLAIVCDDFMRGTTEFLTFDMKTAKDMIDKINDILDKELPWESDTPHLSF